MNILQNYNGISNAKSHRDDTRLTAGFNLRIIPANSQQNPAGMTLHGFAKCRPCRTLDFVLLHIRRLKPAVNKVTSLRDFVLLHIRRLKPAVNKVTSLRDFVLLHIRRLKPAVNKVTSLRDFTFDQLHLLYQHFKFV